MVVFYDLDGNVISEDTFENLYNGVYYDGMRRRCRLRRTNVGAHSGFVEHAIEKLLHEGISSGRDALRIVS